MCNHSSISFQRNVQNLRAMCETKDENVVPGQENCKQMWSDSDTDNREVYVETTSDNIFYLDY